MLVTYGILVALAAGLALFRERELSESSKDRWRSWARRSVVIQVVFFFLYPAFIGMDGGFFVSAAVVSLVPIVWGFYTYFCYRTRSEHYVGLVGGALSIFWIYFAWDSNFMFLFV